MVNRLFGAVEMHILLMVAQRRFYPFAPYFFIAANANEPVQARALQVELVYKPLVLRPMRKPDIHDKIPLFVNGRLYGFQQGIVSHFVFFLVVERRNVYRMVNVLFTVNGDIQSVPQQVGDHGFSGRDHPAKQINSAHHIPPACFCVIFILSQLCAI